MSKLKIRQISLAVCLTLVPYFSFAAGLGKLNTGSGLGEPLKAEIELLSVSADELSTLVATLASEEAYAAQGISRLGIHNNIKVEIAKRADGSPVLKLYSSQPVSDPYLDILIQVDWASGRLQREYTVLLDPPGYKQQVDSTVSMPVVPPLVSISERSMPSERNGSSSAIRSQPPSSPIKAKKLRKAPSQALAPQIEHPEPTGEQKLTTQRGDTLYSIAKEMQVEGVSLDQMLAGLYENNKEAFFSGNMNRLKVGRIIKVPTRESLTSIHPQQAKQSIKVHSVNWSAYRNTLAKAAAATPAALETEQKQTASGKIATAEDKAAPIKAGPQDVVKLSAGEKGAGNGRKGASKALDAEVVALQEEATAREKALKESQERTAALEKQIQDMQKLLALKSQTMVEMQKNAESAAKPPAATVVTPEAPAQVQDIKPEAKSTVMEAGKPQDVNQTEGAAASVADKNVATTPEVKKPLPSTTVDVQPKQEPSLVESLMNAVDLTILGGASAVALLGAIWMFLRNKRRKDLDSFERGILTSAGLRANTVFGNTTGSASTSDTSFLTDFAHSADGSMIDTNDVDPIAEAEVYMAYGRDAQAEEILKDAISKEPKRYELHLKLLEMYAARKDASAFEAVAGELYTTLGANDPMWEKVAEMGATLEPENPLYDVSKVGAAASLSTQKPNVPDFAHVAVSTDAGLDFSIDGDMAVNSQPVVEDVSAVEAQSPSADQSIEKNAEQGVSFDLGSIGSGAIEFAAPEIADVKQSVEENAMENTFNFDSPADNALEFAGDFNLGTESSDAAALMKAMNDLPAFDAVKASAESVEAPALDLSALSENAAAQPMGFDMGFNLPIAGTEGDVEQTSEIVSNVMDGISLDFDTAPATSSQSAVTPSDMAATEISFDLPLNEDQVMDNAFIATPLVAELEANEFDLSSISLDLDEATTESSVEESLTQASVDSAEPPVEIPDSPDVNIKLDLVAAYIDMDDREGARELLEEVIKEGGTQQQLRAEQLLASLA